MPQKLKEEVRERMLHSAEIVFAEAGYGGATMAAIARGAGVSAGNLYRYFANKDELFYALFTDAFAASLLRVLRRRVRRLIATADLAHPDAEAREVGEDLLAFWIAHRRKVIVLLDRAAGSRFEDFGDTFVAELMKPTSQALRARAGCKRLPEVARFTLRNIFDNTVRTIVAILEAHDDEARIREAFAAFWSYQLAGLAGFEEWVTT